MAYLTEQASVFRYYKPTLQPKPTTLLSSRRVYDGDRISLRLDRVQVGNGPERTREVVEHKGSVVVVPLTVRGTVLLVRQWRHAIGKVLLEAPAGTRDIEGETPEQTALRELQEETGHVAGQLRRLPGFWIGPGWCNEYMYAFVATQLRPQKLPQDDDEDVHVAEVPISAIAGLIETGEIQDSKSIASLMCAIHLNTSDKST